MSAGVESDRDAEPVEGSSEVESPEPSGSSGEADSGEGAPGEESASRGSEGSDRQAAGSGGRDPRAAASEGSDRQAAGIEAQPDTSVVDALPALARFAAGAWLRTAIWGLNASARVGARLAQAAVDPESALQLVEGVGAGMRNYAREFLGISDLDERIAQLMPGSDSTLGGIGPATAARLRRARGDSGEPERPQLSLRVQGAELLRQSADVSFDEEAHPAYARILEQLAPDEARILRLLAAEGPQPVVDVRATNLIGVGSQLVEQSLNMVGPQAGCRNPDRVPTYLNNLQRLGLTCFSDEPLQDSVAYQVLEAQPHVLDLIKRTARAKSVQRSLRLTAFGKDFCDVCLPLDTDELEALTEPS